MWALLTRGKADRRHAFHLPVVATGAGGAVDARTVVLRGVDPRRRVLRFHTDARSPKLLGLPVGAPVAWVFYAPRLKQQVRARGHVIAVPAAEVEAAWSRTRPMSRRCYRSPSPPGQPIATPEAGWVSALDDARNAEDQGSTGRDAFTVVETVIEELDWLYLQARGHLRGQLRWQPDRDAFDATWVAP